MKGKISIKLHMIEFMSCMRARVSSFLCKIYYVHLVHCDVLRLRPIRSYTRHGNSRWLARACVCVSALALKARGKMEFYLVRQIDDPDTTSIRCRPKCVIRRMTSDRNQCYSSHYRTQNLLILIIWCTLSSLVCALASNAAWAWGHTAWEEKHIMEM